MDVKETDKAYEVDAEVPGFKKEKIQLSFTDDGNMAITAERKEEHEEKRGGDEGMGASEEAGADKEKAKAPVWYFKERSYGKVRAMCGSVDEHVWTDDGVRGCMCGGEKVLSAAFFPRELGSAFIYHSRIPSLPSFPPPLPLSNFPSRA